jgi:hypothetical protein
MNNKLSRQLFFSPPKKKNQQINGKKIIFRMTLCLAKLLRPSLKKERISLFLFTAKMEDGAFLSRSSAISDRRADGRSDRTDRQTDGQSDRTDRWTVGQTDGLSDRTNRQMDRLSDRTNRTDRQTDGRSNRTDRQTERRTVGMNRQTDRQRDVR